MVEQKTQLNMALIWGWWIFKCSFNTWLFAKDFSQGEHFEILCSLRWRRAWLASRLLWKIDIFSFWVVVGKKVIVSSFSVKVNDFHFLIFQRHFWLRHTHTYYTSLFSPLVCVFISWPRSLTFFFKSLFLFLSLSYSFLPPLTISPQWQF